MLVRDVNVGNKIRDSDRLSQFKSLKVAHLIV